MTASLIIAASEKGLEPYYASGSWPRIPSCSSRSGAGRSCHVRLEVDRARQQARVTKVLSLSEWEAKAKQRWTQPRLTDTVSLLLEDYGVPTVEVPADFPLEAADRLRERG